MQELEKQMAKLEKRRHKSGELREMRRKQQEKEQQKSLETELKVDSPGADQSKFAKKTLSSPDIDELHDAKQETEATPP